MYRTRYLKMLKIQPKYEEHDGIKTIYKKSPWLFKQEAYRHLVLTESITFEWQFFVTETHGQKLI